jgi:hypothetical protein
LNENFPFALFVIPPCSGNLVVEMDVFAETENIDNFSGVVEDVF